MADLTVSKTDWFGGINQLPDKSKVDFATEYSLLVNGRVRENSVVPINGPLDITAGLPTTAQAQGVYGIGRFLLAFAGGLAYYRDYGSAIPAWLPIVGFAMSATEPKIWAEPIPASTLNFVRKSTDGTNFKAPVTISSTRNSSPQAIICMDGVSQAWLIFPDGTARITQAFSEWTQENAEYVPIAKMPFYYNGILYCIGPDLNGTYNQIFRSVTGRPCDFQILVDVNGNPTTGSELQAGAPALAERVDFDATTYVGPINSVDGSWLSTTAQNAYIVTPDYENLIASEPTFRKQYLFSVGAVNDESVTDVLGDTAVIHSRGIRSFNGVGQFKFEGKYAPFNLRINRLLESKVQTISATTTWENYAVFALETVHGYGLLWYDMLLDRFVSLDLYEDQEPIIQFTYVTHGTENKLFAVTNTGRILELFAGTRQRCVVVLADLIIPGVGVQHNPEDVSAVFSGGTIDGYAQVAYIADGAFIGTVTSAIPAGDEAPDAGVVPILGKLVLDSDSTQPIVFNCSTLHGLATRVGIALSWNTDAKLIQTTVKTEIQQPVLKPGAASEFDTQPVKIILLGSDANLTTASAALNQAIQREKPDYVIGLGSHTFLGTWGDIDLRLSPHWDNLHELGMFYAVPGPSELDTSVGEPFFQYVRQAPSRYSVFSTTFANFYLFNSGFNSAGTQVEPANLDGPTLAESTQANWLAAQANSSDKPFNFVLMGTPPRSSAGVAQASLDALPFAELGIDAVLAGLGAYERIEDPKRITFFNSGTGGNVLATFGTPRSDSAVRISSTGYVRLTLTPLSALFEFVDPSGNVLDRRLL